jgi:pyridoxamine 5'-phosphate oxidase
MSLSSPKEPRLPANPFDLFNHWFAQARRHRQIEMPEAMSLATVTASGDPTSRMVLLKDVSPRGFSFFTNIESAKGRQLLRRPRAALLFYWEVLHRQIRVEGTVRPVPKAEADAYFATRPRFSQLGSWASAQSRPLASRSKLLGRVESFGRQFKGKSVPAPDYWRGFRVEPRRFEFWQAQPNRLHDRWLYERKAGRWKISRLYP